MKEKILFSVSVILSLIVVLIGWMWAYFANLFLGIPAALLSFFLWRMTRDAIPAPWNNLPKWLLIAGAFAALAGLMLIL